MSLLATKSLKEGRREKSFLFVRWYLGGWTVNDVDMGRPLFAPELSRPDTQRDDSSGLPSARAPAETTTESLAAVNGINSRQDNVHRESQVRTQSHAGVTLHELNLNVAPAASQEAGDDDAMSPVATAAVATSGGSSERVRHSGVSPVGALPSLRLHSPPMTTRRLTRLRSRPTRIFSSRRRRALLASLQSDGPNDATVNHDDAQPRGSGRGAGSAAAGIDRSETDNLATQGSSRDAIDNTESSARLFRSPSLFASFLRAGAHLPSLVPTPPLAASSTSAPASASAPVASPVPPSLPASAPRPVPPPIPPLFSHHADPHLSRRHVLRQARVAAAIEQMPRSRRIPNRRTPHVVYVPRIGNNTSSDSSEGERDADHAAQPGGSRTNATMATSTRTSDPDVRNVRTHRASGSSASASPASASPSLASPRNPAEHHSLLHAIAGTDIPQGAELDLNDASSLRDMCFTFLIVENRRWHQWLTRESRRVQSVANVFARDPQTRVRGENSRRIARFRAFCNQYFDEQLHENETLYLRLHMQRLRARLSSSDLAVLPDTPSDPSRARSEPATGRGPQESTAFGGSEFRHLEAALLSANDSGAGDDQGNVSNGHDPTPMPSLSAHRRFPSLTENPFAFDGRVREDYVRETYALGENNSPTTINNTTVENTQENNASRENANVRGEGGNRSTSRRAPGLFVPPNHNTDLSPQQASRLVSSSTARAVETALHFASRQDNPLPSRNDIGERNDNDIQDNVNEHQVGSNAHRDNDVDNDDMVMRYGTRANRGDVTNESNGDNRNGRTYEDTATDNDRFDRLGRLHRAFSRIQSLQQQSNALMDVIQATAARSRAAAEDFSYVTNTYMRLFHSASQRQDVPHRSMAVDREETSMGVVPPVPVEAARSWLDETPCPEADTTGQDHDQG